MKAAIYSRKSRYTGKGESVENQIQLCREYASRHLDVAADDFIIYEDEGFSAGNTNRPRFIDMMKDAASRKFDVLICYRLDRVSRNVSDFSQLIKDLKKYNVDFISIREQFDTTTPMGRAMMYIASVFSQLERETIAQRIKDNMTQLAKTGRWLGGRPPTGFESEAVITMDPTGKEKKMFKLSPIPEEINLVRLVYEKYLVFKSLTRVEKYLAENEISTKNGLDFKRYSIRFMLINPVYATADKTVYRYLAEKGYDVCSGIEEFNGVNGLNGYNKTRQDKENSGGKVRDNSEWIISVGMHKGIIPGDVWIEVQNLLEKNKSKSYRKVKNTRSLLSGILRCASCGSHMRPKSVQRVDERGEQVFYYMCEMKEKSRRTRCSISNINGNMVDSLVLDELKQIFQKNFPVIDASSKKVLVVTPENTLQSELEVLQNRISQMDAAVQNIVSVIARGQDHEVINVLMKRMEDYIRDRGNYKKRLMELQRIKRGTELDEVNQDHVAEGLMRFEEWVWEAMETEHKRRMLKSVFEKILWDGKKLDILLFGSSI